MVKVAYFPMIPDDPSCFYRMSGVLNYIDHPELQFFDITQDKEYSWNTFRGCQILILQRPTAPAHITMIKLVKDMGVKVISDWDDDLLNVSVHRNESISLDEVRRNTKMTLHLSEEVWVTTPALKAVYKPYNKNIHIIPNAHHDLIYPVDKKREFDPFKNLAVYRGGASHYDDIGQNINDLVYTIRDSPKWEFRFVGSGISNEKTMFDHLDNRTKGLKNHTFTLPSTLLQFFKNYFEYNAPIAFFPLVTNKFNSSKSNISLLESTYTGSCFLGNKLLPEFDFPFVTDISNGMYEPFEALKQDFTKMRRMNQQAWNWVQENRLLSDINKLRIERLLENGN